MWSFSRIPKRFIVIPATTTTASSASGCFPLSGPRASRTTANGTPPLPRTLASSSSSSSGSSSVPNGMNGGEGMGAEVVPPHHRWTGGVWRGFRVVTGQTTPFSSLFFSSSLSSLSPLHSPTHLHSALHSPCRLFSGTSSGGEEDHYVTLGVPPYASAEEIKAAYKKLALQYHPDRNTEPGAEEKFKSIAAAYNVIGNKKRRQQYDMERQFARGAGMGGGSGGGGMPNMGGAWQQQYHAHSRSPHHAHGSSSYQRMSKEEADELFREMFGSIRVEDIFRAFEEEMRRGNSSAAAGAGGGTGFLRPGASSSARGGFHGFFSRGGGAASSAKSSSTRVYFDADGNRMEEHTFTSPSGTYYRVSQQTSSSSGSHANSSGGGPSASAAAGPGHNGHPFFSRGPGGTGMNDPFERVFSTASHGRGAAHAEQQQEPLGFGAMPNSGMHPPPSMDIRMITFWATVRLISWIIIITTIIWMLLSTMLAHPILAFAILLLMAAGRRGRF